MNTTDLLAYVGAISGVLGALTGSAGAYVAYVSYKKTEKLKALDLRLELRRNVATLQSKIAELPELLTRAKRSHAAVSAATGSYNSGQMQLWTKDQETDVLSLATLSAAAKEFERDYVDLTPTQLETELVELQKLVDSAGRLKDKYDTSLSADERQRDHIRADQRSIVQARISKSE